MNPPTDSGNAARPGDERIRARREARERAVELAYEAEIRGLSVADLVDGLPIRPDRFVVSMLEWAETHRDRVEQAIEARSTGWPLSRMPVMDLVIMRLAAAELLAASTPTGVVLAEAVDLATRYSTDDSGSFINGVLAALADDLRPDGWSPAEAPDSV